MSPEEVRAIADAVVQKLEADKKFIIEEEYHYNEHQKLKTLTKEDVSALKEAATAFRSVRGGLLKISFFFVLVFAMVLSVLAALDKIKLG